MFFADADIAMPPGAVEHMVGARDARQAATEDHWFGHGMRPTTTFRPDLTALRAAPTRIVVGIGEASTGQICDRTSRALAAGLGIEPTPFPGGRIAFVDDPAAFAPRLRAVL